ncbi:MAG: 50S ribosomal protein L17 [Candidatus Pacebacteria bacterium CG_4_9_14_3_um_filter_40_12]|nr:50S ribosomal protein L17 [Candidatus Paceibacterota bacterium]PIR64060.1 MAG: 50S ribosomal protein L17 [Candidatus Pacebacteria bacterium CG10_big_fil_rev_8_21_14_0_10_40_26]PIZ78164.1 MAG: 50S ribosomal protein L17 [Candidatus Pacebacteria bacterium CG_4_10_14_0_2_um_filter_40_20]PJA69136.1 MAG: 50S ribosomal protein L17 [Candidatus Pacebacteria bacterium CG_4_9_14_3_um_filter_40_12]PJC41731.1 MAG: 50S ribosomal protein L17 [Candidatus Pacebacteria bacterium CG_4_9_14_0_2_um_filter_40_15]
MRHRVKGKHLNRDTNHRKMLLRNLVRSLIEVGEITTTEAKAKETKRIADKLIGKARVESNANRRLLHTFFGKRDVVNTLVDRIAPVFKERISGFTTLKASGTRRGDNTKLMTLSLVEKPEVLGTLKNTTKTVEASSAVAEKKAPAKKVVEKKPAKAKATTAAKKTSKKESK